MQQQQPQPTLNIKVPEDLQAGRYANLIVVTHTQEEFFLDFILVSPATHNEGVVVSRVAIHPAHMKRLLQALQDNVKKYEEKFGRLEAAKEPGSGRIGFYASSDK